jgi:uncharacterized membrane protein YfcA
LTVRNCLKLCLISFSSAFFAALSGIGPGSLFNSAFVAMDMHPAAGSATGQFMTLFTTLASTLNLIINNRINLHYSLMINLVSILASIPGLYLQSYVVQKTGRNQFTVLFLLSTILFVLFAMLPVNIQQVIHTSKNGHSIWELAQYCTA